MHVTIKTLQQEKFQVEIDTSETVKALKEKIETEKGKDNFPVEGLKLIYAGKILDDAKTLAEYNMEESKFIVAMITKPKSAPPSTDTKASTSTTAAAATPAAETPASATTAAQPTTPQTTATAGSTPTVTTTEASPTVTASESALDEWQRFEQQLHGAFSGTGDGNVALPSFEMPAMPTVAPPLLPSLADIRRSISQSIEQSLQLPELDFGSVPALPDGLTPAKLEVLGSRIRNAGGIEEFLGSASASSDNDLKDIAAVEALRDVATHTGKSWEELLDILQEGHLFQEAGLLAEATTSEENSSQFAVTGEQFESLIESITAMGFPRDRVETALRASFNNPDRAVEYLMNGLPEGLIPPAAAPGAPTEAPAQEAPATPAVPPGEGGDEANVFDTIRNNRALLMMARTVREDPTLLVSYMQQIGQQNPELLEYIRQHQTEFISFINSLPADERQFVQVTAQEQRDIEQLKALGFSETDCLQAYMAFDKDVEQAANFLFGNMEPWEGTM